MMDSLRNSMNASGMKSKILFSSQKQAVIKMLEKKKDKDKRFIKNWRPISLLNTDMKILVKFFQQE